MSADREARKAEDLLKRDFHAEEPLRKCVTDITEVKASDGKLYVSAVFDCFDSSVLGLAMDTSMKAPLCVQTLENTAKAYPGICGAIIHRRRIFTMTKTQEFTTMEQLAMKVSATSGAVLQYGPLVLVTDTFYRGGFTAEIYEFVETPEEAGCLDIECRLNFCEKAEQIFKDGGRAMDWCLKRAKEHYLNN